MAITQECAEQFLVNNIPGIILDDINADSREFGISWDINNLIVKLPSIENYEINTASYTDDTKKEIAINARFELEIQYTGGCDTDAYVEIEANHNCTITDEDEENHHVSLIGTLIAIININAKISEGTFNDLKSEIIELQH